MRLARTMEARRKDHGGSRGGDDIVYPSAVPFICMHLACLGAIWTGITAEAVAIAVFLYWVRIFAIGAGYHRYFSHRAYSTSRAFQLVLAVLAQSTSQKSVLWWAAKHRHHHRHSDTEEDLHSPRHSGLLYSHVGWIFSRRQDTFDAATVEDLSRFPELRWLHRHERLPALVLAGVCYLVGGSAGLIIGFFWSTVLVYHATFAINSLAHVSGTVRYVTGDDSRNNWLLAVMTMGEGWHNNHHAYQSSARQGFRSWEIDVTFYVLKLLSAIGLVWNVKTPPEAVVTNRRRLGALVIDRAARRLAITFDVEGIAASVAGTLDSRIMSALLDKLSTTGQHAADVLARAALPQVPTRAEIWARAREMFARNPSLEEIVDRAHALILDGISHRLHVRAA
jgi:stearoyl-CoA desaturase (delta-9 desaturase)